MQLCLQTQLTRKIKKNNHEKDYRKEFVLNYRQFIVAEHWWVLKTVALSLPAMRY